MANHYADVGGLNGNVYVGNVGKFQADVVTLYSGVVSGDVTYEIRRKDQLPFSSNSKVSLLLSTVGSTSELVTVLSTAQCKIQLPFRTKFQFRVKNAGVWSDWADFRTRDKRYQTPDCSTQLDVEHVEVSDGVEVHVTNTAKASTELTSEGATVVNTDKWFVDTSEITEVSDGVRVTNKTRIQNTVHGAKVVVV